MIPAQGLEIPDQPLDVPVSGEEKSESSEEIPLECSDEEAGPPFPSSQQRPLTQEFEKFEYQETKLGKPLNERLQGASVASGGNSTVELPKSVSMNEDLVQKRLTLKLDPFLRGSNGYGRTFLPEPRQVTQGVDYSGSLCGCCGLPARICSHCGLPKQGKKNLTGEHTCMTCVKWDYKICAICGKQYSHKFPGPRCRSCTRQREGW